MVGLGGGAQRLQLDVLLQVGRHPLPADPEQPADAGDRLPLGVQGDRLLTTEASPYRAETVQRSGDGLDDQRPLLARYDLPPTEASGTQFLQFADPSSGELQIGDGGVELGAQRGQRPVRVVGALGVAGTAGAARVVSVVPRRGHTSEGTGR